ncbi:hypothetical protein L584_15120 [Pantoea agglomerans Tx10]|jgi:hypothetical protein|nr:hypothetical protein L584_15120 [Pantoea agglomerans Tx10]
MVTDIADKPPGRDTGWHLSLYVALAHNLFKTECIIVFFKQNFIFGMVNIGMFFIEEFNDFEPALVYVKMDITLFKIGRMCLPGYCLGIFFLNQMPGFKAYASSLLSSHQEKEVERIVMGFIINIQHSTSNLSTITKNVK